MRIQTLPGTENSSSRNAPYYQKKEEINRAEEGGFGLKNSGKKGKGLQKTSLNGLHGGEKCAGPNSSGKRRHFLGELSPRFLDKKKQNTWRGTGLLLPSQEKGGEKSVTFHDEVMK